jgi:hypothetical protein
MHDVEAEITSLRLYLRGKARRKTQAEPWEVALVVIAVVLWLL